mgnify:CR=1 FL=1
MKEILVFGHKNPDTDSICSSLVQASIDNRTGLLAKAMRLGNINKETKFVLDYLGMQAPELLTKVEEKQEVKMVDHNEFSQSAEGIDKAKILEVIDHHRISNFQTTEPLFYTTKPYGCTSTILFEEFKRRPSLQTINKEEAALMLSAIISDTLLFKSPTCTKYDIRAVEELAKISGINNVETYGMDMLKAGTDLDDLTEKELINLDAKSLDKNGFKYKIAQVNTVDISNVVKRQINLEKEMQEEIKNDGLNLFVFAITDIVNGNSEIIALGNRIDIIEKSCNLVNNRAFLEGVVSRKKQLLPMIDNNI